MKLRIARKIMKACDGTHRRHSEQHLDRAVRRYEKTRTAKEANRYWFDYFIAPTESGRERRTGGQLTQARPAWAQ